MVTDKQIRNPKQSRSINMKEKILETALKLFCEKGYYKTTTNEIAKTAGVSIGSLYSYFKDKDTILLEILGRYHKQFTGVHNVSLNEMINSFRKDRKAWLEGLIQSLIEIHEGSKELNKELKVLYYSNPEVAKILDEQKEDTVSIIKEYFHLLKDEIKIQDLEAATLVTFDFITAIVDRIVFGNSDIERERILKVGIDALLNFLT